MPTATPFLATTIFLPLPATATGAWGGRGVREGRAGSASFRLEEFCAIRRVIQFSDPCRVAPSRRVRVGAPCACTHRELLGALSGTFRHGRGVARGGAALHLIGPSLVQGGESGVERLCASRFVLGAGLGGDHLDDATAVVAAAAAPAAPAVTASSASSCHCVDVSWVFVRVASLRVVTRSSEIAAACLRRREAAFRADFFFGDHPLWISLEDFARDLTRDLVTVAEAIYRFKSYCLPVSDFGQIWEGHVDLPSSVPIQPETTRSPRAGCGRSTCGAVIGKRAEG